VLEPHWTEKTETMMRVRGRIELVLDWAIAKKFRAAPNPAACKANLDALLDRNARKATVNPKRKQSLVACRLAGLVFRFAERAEGVKGPKRKQSLVACRLTGLVFRLALRSEHAER